MKREKRGRGKKGLVPGPAHRVLEKKILFNLWGHARAHMLVARERLNIHSLVRQGRAGGRKHDEIGQSPGQELYAEREKKTTRWKIKKSGGDSGLT